MTKLLSDTISFLRFPLCCGIVVLHIWIQETEIKGNPTLIVEPFLNQLLQKEIAELAIPLFFAISGLLFFSNIEEFGIIRGGESIFKKTQITSIFTTYTLFILELICFLQRISHRNIFRLYDGWK